MYVESASADSLSATGDQVKRFAGERAVGSLTVEPYSVTTLILP